MARTTDEYYLPDDYYPPVVAEPEPQPYIPSAAPIFTPPAPPPRERPNRYDEEERRREAAPVASPSPVININFGPTSAPAVNANPVNPGWGDLSSKKVPGMAAPLPPPRTTTRYDTEESERGGGVPPGPQQPYIPSSAPIFAPPGAAPGRAKAINDGRLSDYNRAYDEYMRRYPGDTAQEADQAASKVLFPTSAPSSGGGRDVNYWARQVANGMEEEGNAYAKAWADGFRGSFKDFLVTKDAIIHQGNQNRGSYAPRASAPPQVTTSNPWGPPTVPGGPPLGPIIPAPTGGYPTPRPQPAGSPGGPPIDGVPGPGLSTGPMPTPDTSSPGGTQPPTTPTTPTTPTVPLPTMSPLPWGSDSGRVVLEDSDLGNLPEQYREMFDQLMRLLGFTPSGQFWGRYGNREWTRTGAFVPVTDDAINRVAPDDTSKAWLKWFLFEKGMYGFSSPYPQAVAPIGETYAPMDPRLGPPYPRPGEPSPPPGEMRL